MLLDGTVHRIVGSQAAAIGDGEGSATFKGDFVGLVSPIPILKGRDGDIGTNDHIVIDGGKLFRTPVGLVAPIVVFGAKEHKLIFLLGGEADGSAVFLTAVGLHLHVILLVGLNVLGNQCVRRFGLFACGLPFASFNKCATHHIVDVEVVVSIACG